MNIHMMARGFALQVSVGRASARSGARCRWRTAITIAPKGDRSVYKYENDRSLVYKNLTSGSGDAKVYELICKGEKGMVRYEIEPDEAS